MGFIWFLVVFPLVAAILCLATQNERVRGGIVCVCGGIIAVASIVFAVMHIGGEAVYFAFSSEVVSMVFFVVELALCAYVMWRALSAKRMGVFALACVQALLVCMLEFGPAGAVKVRHALYADTLSCIMVLVIGVIGSAICIYAVGYMHDFQRHQDELAREGKEFARDRQTLFFAVMFAFLGAMFGIVLFNDLAWLLCMWEVTTVCSFFLIGYTQTAEATNNAFRQIWMNLIGGIAFSIALVVIGTTSDIMELNRFVNLGQMAPGAVMLPAALLALAALTKAAQMPFHTWLLGAMVAPTPTSALLHSSTMVKAGVFLLIKLAPVMGTFVASQPRLGLNPVGVMVMLVGASTFLLASILAVSQSNAKRVLAYSTIANLGLIATCAGIGSGPALWAAIFLLVFHACAKSLLFLCVGTAEHHVGSRDIERFDSLITRMPRLAILMALGICGMFIAPFGMLISKWAALSAFIGSGIIVLVVMLAVGSAATFFFWAKWLVKIMAAREGATNVENGVHPSEWGAMSTMGLLLVVLTVLLPLLSNGLVAPYANQLVGGGLADPGLADLVLMSSCALVTILVPAAYALRAHTLASRGDGHQRYFNGIAVDNDHFMGSLGNTVAYEQRNWYLEDAFSESKIGLAGTVLCVVIAGMGIAASLGMTLVFLGSVI